MADRDHVPWEHEECITHRQGYPQLCTHTIGPRCDHIAPGRGVNHRPVGLIYHAGAKDFQNALPDHLCPAIARYSVNMALSYVWPFPDQRWLVYPLTGPGGSLAVYAPKKQRPIPIDCRFGVGEELDAKHRELNTIEWPTPVVASGMKLYAVLHADVEFGKPEHVKWLRKQDAFRKQVVPALRSGYEKSSEGDDLAPFRAHADAEYLARANGLPVSAAYYAGTFAADERMPSEMRDMVSVAVTTLTLTAFCLCNTETRTAAMEYLVAGRIADVPEPDHWAIHNCAMRLSDWWREIAERPQCKGGLGCKYVRVEGRSGTAHYEWLDDALAAERDGTGPIVTEAFGWQLHCEHCRARNEEPYPADRNNVDSARRRHRKDQGMAPTGRRAGKAR